MTGHQLLKFLQKQSPESLKQDILFVCEENSTSGVISKIKKQPFGLLYDGEDDPSPLHSRNHFLKEGYDVEDVDSFAVEIPKGSIVIEI